MLLFFLNNKMKTYIKSPLNYTGGKFKLLSILKNHFPYENKKKIFVDLFCGGFNVGINMTNYKKIIAIDENSYLIGILNYFKKNSFDYIEKKTDEIIDEFNLTNSYYEGYKKYNIIKNEGLSRYNKDGFNKLKDYYNSTKDLSHLFVLIIYGFNHQIRFNSKKIFNIPVGKSDFNKNIRENLKLFCDNLKKIEVNFICDDFKNLNKYVSFNEIDFIYCDPPYILSKACYNENSLWQEKDEKELFYFLNNIDSKNIKFALSNILVRGENKNNLLLNFLKNYEVININFNYNNSNYQKVIKEEKEVLIKNY